MNTVVLIIVAIICAWFFLSARGGIKAPDAAARVAAGTAILIDVREPSEWRSGVAAPAHLLSLSDLQGDRRQWKPVLEQNRDKLLIFYCQSGMRSSQAARKLKNEGFSTINLGGFGAWKSAGLPIRTP